MDQEMLNEVLTGLPLPALMIGADERISGCNAAALALLGAGLVGRHHAFVLRQPEVLAAISAAAGRIIVAADTAVVLDGVAYGKPVDDDDARAMLRRLSGCTHQVMTGWCVRRDDVFDGGVVATDVTFRRLDDDDINRWLATGEHRDKAGAYAIQGAAMVFVARVGGCLSNVVGLPVETVVAAVERAVAGQGQ